MNAYKITGYICNEQSVHRLLEQKNIGYSILFLGWISNAWFRYSKYTHDNDKTNMIYIISFTKPRHSCFPSEESK